MIVPPIPKCMRPKSATAAAAAAAIFNVRALAAWSPTHRCPRIVRGNRGQGKKLAAQSFQTMSTLASVALPSIVMWRLACA